MKNLGLHHRDKLIDDTATAVALGIAILIAILYFLALVPIR